MSNLSLTVKPNHPLIITGPNGSGKSSVFRVLGGLWEIPSGGRVFRPVAESDGSEIPVFLVPQKPYHCNGSLADQVRDGLQCQLPQFSLFSLPNCLFSLMVRLCQITYPHVVPSSHRTIALERKLMQLLQLVEVQNLVERWSWHDARVVRSVVVDQSKAEAGVLCAYECAAESCFTRRGQLRSGSKTRIVEVTQEDVAAEGMTTSKISQADRPGIDSIAGPTIRSITKLDGKRVLVTDLSPGDKVKLLFVSTDPTTGLPRFAWSCHKNCSRLFQLLLLLPACTSSLSIKVCLAFPCIKVLGLGS